MSELLEEQGRLVAAALAALGKRRLVLAIHDASFPSAPGEDTGRGSPYGRGAADFLGFAGALGFNGVLLGPQGQTSRVNPSPYDGTIFSKSMLSIALPALVDGAEPLLDRAALESVIANRPPGASGLADYRYLFDAQEQALRRAYAALPSQPSLRPKLEAFAAAARPWLERDALFAALLREYGDRHPDHWQGPAAPLDRRLFSPAPGFDVPAMLRREALARRHADEIGFYTFCQYLAHEQHRGLQARARASGLTLYGDLQIGLSVQDRWAYGALFLTDYLMGAPPSRTNPDGQPWSYPVLDPQQYGTPQEPGPALRLVAARVGKLLGEFDGVRIDHPHGLVCPWVYRAAEPDPLRAVQGGARLFDSPDLPDHAALGRYAIARPEQLRRDVPRHDDGWVRELDDGQVARYALLIDAIVAAAAGREVLCEVLSTLPYPLRRVMERHRMGRFRVTQKADLGRREDVYRSENAEPADWIMMGNHDTPPIWLLAEGWARTEKLATAQAAYLAERLSPDAGARAELAERLAADPNLLVQAKFADLFASRAENVMVFFADLLGLKQIYNRPGTIDEQNWFLRVPAGYAADYRARLQEDAALNLPLALALAVRARGAGFAAAHAELLARLDTLAAALRS